MTPNNTIKLGQAGEEQAKKYLLKLGYRILDCNWRFKKFEIDIIAQKNQNVVFVEVKWRKNESYGAPEVFVDKKKQVHLITAAHHYMLQNSLTLEARFDIIAINQQSKELTHLEGAFFPTIQ